MSDFIQFTSPPSLPSHTAGLSKGIKKCLKSCYHQWFDLYVEEVENLYGRDGAIVKEARKSFDKQQTNIIQDEASETLVIVQYVPTSQGDPLEEG